MLVSLEYFFVTFFLDPEFLIVTGFVRRRYFLLVEWLKWYSS
jgi:hypothetical protein